MPTDPENHPPAGTSFVTRYSGTYTPSVDNGLSEELRIDVDGRHPQYAASGFLRVSSLASVHWIADLEETGQNTWRGEIGYKYGSSQSFPYTRVVLELSGNVASNRMARATFAGGVSQDRTVAFKFRSTYFHAVELEFDCVEGTEMVTELKTDSHPIRPASLVAETLTLQTVFRRAGFDVRSSSNGGRVPLSGAGANATWSNAELHDAMQQYWSRFANVPQWAFWTVFASIHETGSGLGGVMFDEIGPEHRQGSAIFADSFLTEVPIGVGFPDAWIRRMRFWCAAHEMGHAFNLAHSWRKSVSEGSHRPWLSLENEPEARSFMNYPKRVSGGSREFFASFEYRFSDSELFFMRHAPSRFVQMGDAAWLEDYAFRDERCERDLGLRLSLRLNKDQPVFEFMEGVVAELKLTNTSDITQVIDPTWLESDELVAVIRRDRGPSVRHRPFARYCLKPDPRDVAPGESVYHSIFLSAGVSGWDLAEPGRYTLRAALDLDGGTLISNSLELKVLPPRNHEEEVIAQDFFTDHVGRILAFDGSACLSRGLEVLQLVIERLEGREVSRHARVALGCARSKPFKQVVLDAGSGRPTGISIRSATLGESIQQLERALQERSDLAAQSLGHVDYLEYFKRLLHLVIQDGDMERAQRLAESLLTTLSRRKVSPRVLERFRESFAVQAKDARVGAVGQT